MARDRKRAKQRQRRAQRASSPRVAVEDRRAGKNSAPPDPLEHASADVDIAEAALGRTDAGEPTGLERDEVAAAAVAPELEAEAEAALEPEAEPAEEAGEPSRAARRQARGEAAGIGGEQTRAGGNRLINFFRACWAELQRVQWPDRRQVAQATGVVLGFVAIAGAYLGVMDAIFSRVVDAIL